jgi:hypothetical protein
MSRPSEAEMARRREAGRNMADKRSLGVLGFLFGGLTVAVSLTAFVIVRAHVLGDLQLGDVGLSPHAIVLTVK